MLRDARGLAECTPKLRTMLDKKTAGRAATPRWAASETFLARSIRFWKSEILLCARSHEQGHTILAELAQAFRHVLSGITQQRDLVFEFVLISKIAPASGPRCDVNYRLRVARHLSIRLPPKSNAGILPPLARR